MKKTKQIIKNEKEDYALSRLHQSPLQLTKKCEHCNIEVMNLESHLFVCVPYLKSQGYITELWCTK